MKSIGFQTISLLLIISFLSLFSSCQKHKKEPQLFTSIPPDLSGVSFKNTVIQNESFNLFSWKYIYNGAGVAAGDINNDGYTDIFFTSNQGKCGLFLNKGNLTFEDITSQAGVSAKAGYKTGVTMADINGDGWLDIYVCRDADPDPNFRNNHVFINNKNGTFTDKAKELKLEDESYSTHALFLDFDRDSDLDLFLINHPADFEQSLQLRLTPNGRETIPRTPYSGNKLYRNDIQFFTEISQDAGLAYEGFALSTLAVDINEDGWLDIFVGNDFLEPDLLYINQKDGTFKDSSYYYFDHISQNTMGSSFSDINNDGLVDLITLDMLARDHYRQKLLATTQTINRYETWEKNEYGRQIMRNMVQLNQGNGNFSEIGQSLGLDKTDWSWSVLIRDFDRDGNQDVFITNGIERDMANSDFIVFYADSLQKNLSKGYEGFDAKAYSTLIEKIPSTPLPNLLFLQNNRLEFTSNPSVHGIIDPGFSQGAAAADLDNDGDLDLVVSNYNNPVTLYKNNSQEKSTTNYLKVRLIGSGMNSYGLGATIRVKTKNRMLRQWMQPNGSYLSSQEPLLFFGLGDINEKVDIEVAWLSGLTSLMSDIEVNQTIEVYESHAKNIPPTASHSLNFWKDHLVLTNIEYIHTEDELNDFKISPTQLWARSNLGPSIVAADFTKDGKEDIFIGGASGQSSCIFVQKDNNTFTRWEDPLFTQLKEFEELEALCHDINEDGWIDLFLFGLDSKDNNNFPEGRILLNEKGKWFRQLKRTNLQGIGTSAVIIDLNRDGVQEIIAAGKINTDQKSSYHDILSVNLSLEENPTSIFSDIGEVTAIKSIQLTNDSHSDVVISGHWMPITLISYTGKTDNEYKIVEIGEAGWWNTLHTLDIDRDGDMDILAGNMGTNIAFAVDQNFPYTQYTGDFDLNGINDVLISAHLDGISGLIHRREVLMKELPIINKYFNQYSSYAAADATEVLSSFPSKYQNKKYVKETRSGLYLNYSGSFKFIPFPVEAQFFPIFSIMPFEDEDELYFLLTGNQSKSNIQNGPLDAGKGLVLQYKNDQFNVVPSQFEHLKGDIRKIVPIKIENKKYYGVGASNSPLKIINLKYQ